MFKYIYKILIIKLIFVKFTKYFDILYYYNHLYIDMYNYKIEIKKKNIVTIKCIELSNISTLKVWVQIPIIYL